jgi:hypothetical protein
VRRAWFAVLLSALAATQASAQLMAAEDGATKSRPHRLAIVAGVNHPASDTGLSELQYADTDAARMAEILRRAGAQVRLLADPGRDAQAWFPWITDEQYDIATPTKAALLRAFDDQVAQANSLRRAAAHVELYFFFSGHGRFNPETAEGELVLADGVLGRHELYDRLIRRLDEQDLRGNYRLHIILDACNARNVASSKGDLNALLVNAARGATRDRSENYPRVGWFALTVPRGDAYEIPGLQGGILTRELSSALLGMADVDQNGAITYEEADAFVRTANLRFNRGKAPSDQLEVFVKPPYANDKQVLLNWEATTRVAPYNLGAYG